MLLDKLGGVVILMSFLPAFVMLCVGHVMCPQQTWLRDRIEDITSSSDLRVIDENQNPDLSIHSKPLSNLKPWANSQPHCQPQLAQATRTLPHQDSPS
jgi:hypothetical protein